MKKGSGVAKAPCKLAAWQEFLMVVGIVVLIALALALLIPTVYGAYQFWKPQELAFPSIQCHSHMLPVSFGDAKKSGMVVSQDGVYFGASEKTSQWCESK